jgi:hypothetical protein
MNQYLPLINAITCQYTGNIGSANVAGNILSNISGAAYIKTYNPNTTVITGVVLIKASPTNLGNITAYTGNYYNIVFPQDNGGNTTTGMTRSAYVYTDASIANLQTANTSIYNTLNVYYQNYSILGNNSYVNFNSFLASGPPSAPQSISTSSITSSTMTVTYTAPLYGDSNNPSTVTAITNYRVNYHAYSNTIRYGGIYSTANLSVTTASLSTSLSSLTSDTTYTINAQAMNGVNANFGPNITSITALTLNISAAITTLGSLTFSPSSTSGKLVSTGSSVSTIIYSNTALTSSSLTAPINETSNRGIIVSSGNIANISIAITGGATITGPTVGFSSFPIALPNAQTQNNVILTPVSVTDSYSGSSAGYYLQTSLTVTLNTAVFTATNSQYTVTLSRVGYTTSTPVTYQFYYDIAPTTPTIGNVNLSNISTVSGTTYKQVSGVYVVYGSPTLYVTTSNIANVGQYFYNSTRILAYGSTTGTVSATETTLARTLPLVSGSSITGNINIVHSSVGYTTTTYSSTISVSSTVYNLIGTTAVLTSGSLSAISDPLSVTLVYTTLQQSLGSMTNSAKTGYRVWSGLTAFNSNTLPNITSSGTAYSTIQYDNTWDISGVSGSYNPSQELQVGNGLFQTITSSTTAYKNYSGTYYSSTLTNSVNYSGIYTAGYRYSTFVWYGTAPGSGNYGGIYFIINGQTVTTTVFSGLAYADAGHSNKIIAFYRIEDNNSLSLSTDGSTLTSNWISANDTTPAPVNSSNYYSGSTYYYGLNSVSTTSTTTTFDVNLPVPFTSTNVSGTNIRIYFRIGLPMNIQFAFTTITGYFHT